MILCCLGATLRRALAVIPLRATARAAATLHFPGSTGPPRPLGGGAAVPGAPTARQDRAGYRSSRSATTSTAARRRSSRSGIGSASPPCGGAGGPGIAGQANWCTVSRQAFFCRWCEIICYIDGLASARKTLPLPRFTSHGKKQQPMAQQQTPPSATHDVWQQNTTRTLSNNISMHFRQVSNSIKSKQCHLSWSTQSGSNDVSLYIPKQCDAPASRVH